MLQDPREMLVCLVLMDKRALLDHEVYQEVQGCDL